MDFKKMTDEELINLLEEEVSETKAKAIEQILDERGYEIEFKEGVDKTGEIDQLVTAKHSLLPLCLGILFVATNYFAVNRSMEPDIQFTLVVGIGVIVRVISIFWLTNLAKMLRHNNIYGVL